MYLSEEIFYDFLGIGIQIREGAKSALRCPRIWLPKFDVIIFETIAHKVNGGIQIRGRAKSALRCPRIWLPEFDVIILEANAYKVNGGIQIRGGSKSALRVIQIRSRFWMRDPNPRASKSALRARSHWDKFWSFRKSGTSTSAVAVATTKAEPPLRRKPRFPRRRFFESGTSALAYPLWRKRQLLTFWRK